MRTEGPTGDATRVARGIENRLWSMEDGASLLSGAKIIFAPVR
jgi:hypothetical protein